MRLAVSIAVCAVMCSPALAQDAPAFATRQAVLKSLVYVRAAQCADGTQRAGSGFTFETPATIVTAHHVVGGCATIDVTYEGVDAGAPRSRRAAIRNVLATGDLALLSVDGAPAVPVLKLAAPPPDRGKMYAGFGYQNGQPTAGDVPVAFSTGSEYLRDILPSEARRELQQTGSAIDLDRRVLRFNVALQPGMSGGPIIDLRGEVIGIVAGGLKAGAAPASWGWPSELVRALLTSNEAPQQQVRLARAYYSLSEMDVEAAALRDRREVRCGSLTFTYRGTRTFADVAAGADDQPRLQYIMSISTRPRSEIDALKFDVWVHAPSGATAVTPSGYQLEAGDGACIVRSNRGPFKQAIWGAKATNPMEIAQVSSQFEITVMAALAPYAYGFMPDPSLTTMGPQFRDNGMVFNRKGFTQPKTLWVPGAPAPHLAHTFETLIAKSGSFLGVGTLNDDMPANAMWCLQQGDGAPGCENTTAHIREWTHFILATQLSTYPST